MAEPPPSDDLQATWFEAARRGDAELLAALIRAGLDVEATDARGFSALVLASYHGHEEATRLLMTAGAKPDGAGEGDTALMGAAFKGHTDVARALLAAGADATRANAAGETPLTFAEMAGQQAVADLLLAHGAERTRDDEKKG